MKKSKTIHLLRRLGFFLIGLSIGIFILNYIMDKKGASFDYLPNARTLKSIRNKPHLIYSSEVLKQMEKHQIDSTAILSLLFYGDVNFRKSDNARDKPCQTYLIEPTKKTEAISIVVERCDSVAIISEMKGPFLK